MYITYIHTYKLQLFIKLNTNVSILQIISLNELRVRTHHLLYSKLASVLTNSAHPLRVSNVANKAA